MKYTIISGPTAVGKTDIVLEIASQINANIISVDSRQIYKLMDIGTAKPSKEEKSKVTHYLIDHIYPDEYYNAFLFRQDALKIRDKLVNEGIVPLFVGGTGLYIDSLVRGFFEGVPKDEKLRKELSEMEKNEPGILRSMLEKYDPQAAQKIHPSDIKRTIRALEVYFKTGKKISQLQTQSEYSKDYKILVLDRYRDELYERINLRVDKMIKEGLVDEVKSLLEKYPKDLNAFQTIGYKEIIRYLENTYDLNTAVHLIKKNTRHYARRQIIWLRRYKQAKWINLSEISRKKAIEEIKKFILEV
ncbi:tRNA delta(2)-isopentenylpyrophosphate transferase [Thermosipho africanus H17ap60334]|jgi:tRNA dimethylallyltransferase|uniref:tRNA dimethylallyltransferase n=1 Tax=Thermosipho africanus (strain TCF52B) TaxID=484019 RepID=MIAA_THEAB|nr:MULTISPECIES: tRNA (adenosine(37)-N6)-dimethylallyltransferase MiaA [Thermosipho]B7IDS3.1 RecName: Full=tRNA dimethylallyltransferase; AltName: Full=Dimethylallyl diphosphate:tRNA dimethylallyltransferase; Short=DMAPP:tRNA dimethylallyltransferase; Short=DMATase; AltName: Full=Isopentenyl-diphosphate:tRNA isopentenyltransferase; Short=IPP transferase; Short=IPPT; Short=IPTase [Thermosipho africanus TCF52B]ACJ76150.1 tRNA delta(2)-isopentenylpyrophosphate transferase [Thermosipho africanus TCF5